MPLPRAGELPQTFIEACSILGKEWGRSPQRPRIAPDVLDTWSALLEAWVASDLPLLVRKGSSIRGSQIIHSTGRAIVMSDNSPAQWAFTQAYEGQTPTLNEIADLFDRDQIPCTFVSKTSERAAMQYRCTLSARYNVGKKGWKLCHIKPIGLRSSRPIETIDISVLAEAFRAFLSPSNHFLVPLTIGGIGEVETFIQAVATAREGS